MSSQLLYLGKSRISQSLAVSAKFLYLMSSQLLYLGKSRKCQRKMPSFNLKNPLLWDKQLCDRRAAGFSLLRRFFTSATIKFIWRGGGGGGGGNALRCGFLLNISKAVQPGVIRGTLKHRTRLI